MAMRSRLILSLAAVVLAVFFDSGCGHYFCNATFGASSCPGSSGSGSGFGGTGGTGGTGGGGGGSAAAYLYAVDQTTGKVDGYELNPTANTLGAIPSFAAPTIPTSYPGINMVVAQTKFVYAYFETVGQLYGWSLTASSGALTPLGGFPITLSLSAPIVGYNEYNIATNPAGTFLFLSDTTNLQILAYQVSTTGALTAVTGSPFSTGIAEPGNLSTDGLGKYLYATQSLGGHAGGEILAYAIDSSGGLTAVTGSPFTVSPGMWQVQGDASGNFLIGTSGTTAYFSGTTDDKSLYVFSIQQTGTNAGALTQVTGSPFATIYAPLNIAVSPSSTSEFVYSFGINDSDTAYNPVEGFSLSTTGTLTPLAGSPFSNITAGEWGEFDQSGAYLVDYNSVFNGTTTTTELSSLSVDSSTGVLTQPVASVTIATPGVWVVTDPQ